MLKRHRTPQNSVYNVVTPDDLSIIANVKNLQVLAAKVFRKYFQMRRFVANNLMRFGSVHTKTQRGLIHNVVFCLKNNGSNSFNRSF